VNHYDLFVIVAGLLAVVGLFALAGAGRRKARRAAHGVRRAGRSVSLSGRVLVTAAAIVGVQYAVIRYGHTNITLLLAALALPALLAAVPLARAVTVTSVVTSRKGVRR
jgi:hypothetical protein